MIRLLALLVGTLALVALAKPSSSPSPQPSISPSLQPSVSPSSPLRSPRSPNVSPSPGSAPAAFDLGVWTVHASSLDANFKTGDFSTPAKVVMTRVGGDVTADRANGNYKKQELYLNGHVVMHDSISSTTICRLPGSAGKWACSSSHSGSRGRTTRPWP